MTERNITIIDVCEEIGVKPDSWLTWPVGNRIKNLWKDKTGNLPPKELRKKTNGKGSHCFAVYPLSMKAEIEIAIKDVKKMLGR